jgi:hypothetical protein
MKRYQTEFNSDLNGYIYYIPNNNLQLDFQKILNYIQNTTEISCYLNIGNQDKDVIYSIKKAYKLNNLQIHNMKINDEQYSDMCIDLLTCFDTININIIDESYRLLKKNGIFIILTNQISEEVVKYINDKFIIGFQDENYTCYIFNNINNKNTLYRKLPQNLKREKYYGRWKEFKNITHWGQRKLLLSEIEFLTIYSNGETTDKKKYVIYVGAAPGTHIIYLSKLFPDVYFELYDPRDFNNKLSENNKIKTHQAFFTDEIANEWKSINHKDKDILFISDIRTGSSEFSEEKFEACVKDDNFNQMKWYNIIKPIFTMFKFRLPYNSDNITEYLDGEIYLQAYAPATSTETRLMIGANASLKKYDDRTYEEQLFYFNKYERSLLYDNLLYDIVEKNGIKNNYDNASEINIIQKYLEYINYAGDYNKKIIQMIKAISRTLSNNRNLYSEQPINDKKREILIKLQKNNFVPLHIELNQKTFDIYVIPKYNYYKNLGYNL